MFLVTRHLRTSSLIQSGPFSLKCSIQKTMGFSVLWRIWMRRFMGLAENSSGFPSLLKSFRTSFLLTASLCLHQGTGYKISWGEFPWDDYRLTWSKAICRWIGVNVRKYRFKNKTITAICRKKFLGYVYFISHELSIECTYMKPILFVVCTSVGR